MKKNYDLNDECLKELKKVLKKYKVKFLGHVSERAFITFQDRTQYYISYNEDDGLEVVEYRQRYL